MGEYIEREALMEKFSARSPLLMQIRAYIAAEPAADVTPVVHGRWIKRPDERICPFCDDSHAYFGGADWNYCPNCGARMDGE